MRRRLSTAAVVLSLTIGVLAQASPAAACDTIADFSTWSDNCLTYWGSYRVSDLTTGVQGILKYDGRPGWVSATDGIYGTTSGGGETPAAVKVFQDDQGLADDGKTGVDTWNALDNTFVFHNTSTDYKHYKIGSYYDRMRVKKSNNQAYIERADGVWVRVDAWLS